MRGILARAGLAVFSALATLAVCELGFRALEGRLGVDHEQLARFREFVASEGDLAQYVPRPYTLYVRSAERERAVNRLGFLDKEFAREKAPGTLRIACIGSSTTEGGNSAAREGSYPYFLGPILEQRLARPVETLNFGMSGWTSAEELVNYVLVVQDYAPDVVLIHEAVNDVEPRLWPGFEPDYSHYRRPWQPVTFSWPYRTAVGASDIFAALQMRRGDLFDIGAAVTREPTGPIRFEDGHLAPETGEPFKRNLRTIGELVKAHGGRPVIVTMPYNPERADEVEAFEAGIVENNALLRDLAREQGFLLVDLEARARAEPERWRPQFLDLVHVTPEGNRLKAEAIADALIAGGPPGGKAVPARR